MRAGLLNKAITFRRKTIAFDAKNENNETWADAFTVWSEIRTEDGREFYAAQKLHSETSVLFILRYRSDIDKNMRVKFGNQTYEILHLNNVKKNDAELRVSAKEVT